MVELVAHEAHSTTQLFINHHIPEELSLPNDCNPAFQLLNSMATPREDHSPSKSRSKSQPKSGETDDEKPRTPSTNAEKSKSKSFSRSPEKSGSPERPKRSSRRSNGEREYASSQSSSNALSIDALAKLNALNEKTELLRRDETAKQRRKEERRRDKEAAAVEVKERHRRKEHREHREARGHRESREPREKREKRTVSGAILEEGRGRRGGWGSRASEASVEGRRCGKGCWIVVGIILLLLIILIPVGVFVIGRHSGGSAAPATPTSNLGGQSEDNIPEWAKGSYLDPFTWLDTADFNTTFTNDTVGGLSVMGLNSTWDDSTQANQYVPPLNQKFNYGVMPIRGVNVGGWLSIEPFITPSLFSSYSPDLGIVDEYTLCQHLGTTGAAQTLEKHYSTFINKQSFLDIQNAGFDHVRISFSYWAVTTYDGDPYVPKISWRYLLRGIEYARESGLRVNLDLHGVPGSQNGWNHSGRQGEIGWLNGTDGTLNGQRSLNIHNQLSTFFAQPRYGNVVGIYGLVNEPKMTALPTDTVLEWTQQAIAIIRQNGIQQTIAFGDGFLGLPNWQGKLQGIANLVLDAHQYVIFNIAQIAFTHQTKLNFACSGWSGQQELSLNTATGYVNKYSPYFLQHTDECPKTATAPQCAENGPKQIPTAPPT